MAKVYIMLESNDILVEVRNLQDSSDDSFVNTATITAVLKDANGATVTGQVMPIVLSYVGSSNGIYQGVFDAAVNVVAGQTGTIEITAVDGTLDAFWALPYRVKTRIS